MSFYQFQVPTRILAGIGLSRDFAHECELLGLNRFLVVSDGMLKSLGLIDPIVAGLVSANIEVCGEFLDVPPDSSVATVKACADAARKCGALGFLAIGGGSVLDTAKGANILHTLGGDLRVDYAGAQTLERALAPLIAIPTTAGTGSEVTEAMVIYDEETKTKLSFVDKHLVPTMAILDPELTLQLPAKLTAATALDALTHAIEATLSIQRGPVSDALAFEAIRLIFANLPKVLELPTDVDARFKLLSAANLAGMAFNHAMVGVVHAVAHSVGALAHVHHGTANAIFLRHGLEFNLPEVEPQLANLARVTLSLQGENQRLAADFIEHVSKFVETMSFACGLALDYCSAGVDVGLIDEICNLAVEDGASFYNPRTLTIEDLKPFVQRAFGL